MLLNLNSSRESWEITLIKEREKGREGKVGILVFLPNAY
jgi:hypothetical protein